MMLAVRMKHVQYGCPYSCINVTYVSNDIAVTIKNGKRCYAFIVHEPQRVRERFVAIDRNNDFRAELELLQRACV